MESQWEQRFGSRDPLAGRGLWVIKCQSGRIPWNGVAVGGPVGPRDIFLLDSVSSVTHLEMLCRIRWSIAFF